MEYRIIKLPQRSDWCHFRNLWDSLTCLSYAPHSQLNNETKTKLFFSRYDQNFIQSIRINLNASQNTLHATALVSEMSTRKQENLWLLIELSQASPKIKPGSFDHASFTYVLTATTSPILHFCRGRKKSDFSKTNVSWLTMLHSLS